MPVSEILFWFLTALALFSALMVVFSNNPVHSVLWLIVVFFAISGHYILMNAQFLAIVNMIVYAGAIMVLFLFVIMLMNMNTEAEPQKSQWMKMAAAISGGALMLVMIAALKDQSGRIITAKTPCSLHFFCRKMRVLIKREPAFDGRHLRSVACCCF